MSLRNIRIQQILLEEISSMIVLGKIKDPRVSKFLTIMHVKLSKDSTSAQVFVSSYADITSVEQSVHALNHAKGFIQSHIAKKYSFKYTPKLLFKSSKALTDASKVLNIINTISNKK